MCTKTKTGDQYIFENDNFIGFFKYNTMAGEEKINITDARKCAEIFIKENISNFGKYEFLWEYFISDYNQYQFNFKVPTDFQITMYNLL